MRQYILSGATVALLLVGVAALILPVDVSADSAPVVNGLFYGDGDYQRYAFLGEDPGRGALYYHQDTNGILSLAMVVSSKVNDNVFGDSKKGSPDEAYVKSAGWTQGSGRSADKLIESDHFRFKFVCNGQEWTWSQDYAYDLDNDLDPHEADWRSYHLCNVSSKWCDGADAPPPGWIKSASSLQWDLNHAASNPATSWDVTLGATACQRTSETTWKSPDDVECPLSDNDVRNNGHPTYDTVHQWEWAMVYETSIDLDDACGVNRMWTFEVVSAHNSPPKTGDENVVVPNYDLGDAPDSYGTLRASNGPRHRIVIGGPFLGERVDPEGDGQPGAGATGDDDAGAVDDEDGVRFAGHMRPGEADSLTVTLGQACPTETYLDAWIDYNGNGQFDHPGEQLWGGTSQLLDLGSNSLPFVVPAIGTYARFRVSCEGGLLPTGEATNGEVEDYYLGVPPRLDRGQGDRSVLHRQDVLLHGAGTQLH